MLILWCLLALVPSSIVWAQADFYDVNSIQEIKIKFEQDNWRYVLDSLRFDGEGLLLGAIEVNGQKNRDAAWYYPQPSSAASQIKDHVAFWRGVQVT